MNERADFSRVDAALTTGDLRIEPNAATTEPALGDEWLSHYVDALAATALRVSGLSPPERRRALADVAHAFTEVWCAPSLPDRDTYATELVIAGLLGAAQCLESVDLRDHPGDTDRQSLFDVGRSLVTAVLGVRS